MEKVHRLEWFKEFPILVRWQKVRKLSARGLIFLRALNLAAMMHEGVGNSVSAWMNANFSWLMSVLVCACYEENITLRHF